MDAMLEEDIYGIDEVFFRERNCDASVSCMCFGIECGDGWHLPIKRFARKVSLINKVLKPIGRCIVCEQMKSKWSRFTCYWNIVPIDENSNELDKLAEGIVESACELMADAVDCCEKECSCTCEICGKHSLSKDDVFVCGSWLTVKCLPCAQDGQRKSNVIDSFSDGFRFLSLMAGKPMEFDGVEYKSVAGAYYGTLYPEYNAVFSSLPSSNDVCSVVKSLGLNRIDDYAFAVLKKVLEARYLQNEDERELLLSTSGMIVDTSNISLKELIGYPMETRCENDVQAKYGKVVMDVRDKLIASGKKDA